MTEDAQRRPRPVKSYAHTCVVPSRVHSHALLGQANELVIVHNGREYRLRMTQNGKLILTA